MPLERQQVDKKAGEHIRLLQETRAVSQAEKDEIRMLHEQMARKVAVDNERRR